MSDHSHDRARSEHLLALLDAGDVAQLMTEVTLREVNDAWLCHSLRGASAAPSEDWDDDWWAVETWFSPEWWSDEERVRSGLIDLIERAPSDDVLAVVAAGPLEVFVTDDESRLHWIERQADTSPRFRQALAGVWVFGGEVSDETFVRLERAARQPLPSPDDQRQRRERRMRKST
jgi:hypothetical protein